MAENELLKQINRELKVTSMENSEKKSAKNKDETDDNDKKESDDVLDDNAENAFDEMSEDDEELSDEEKDLEKEREELDDLNDVEKDVEDVASEQTEEVKDELSDFVLSSAPQLLDPEDLPVERNEIDDPVDASGILKDYKADKTSDFIDPNGDDSDKHQLKVVDTALGVFTILNSDDKNVLLLDSNKQKIQISINDFNNLHPFEIKDDMLSDVNSFTDAFEKDLKIKKEKQKMDAEEEGNEEAESGFGESEDEIEEEPEEEAGNALSDLGGFGESVKRRRRRVKKENKNLISEIQKGLSKKSGVVETIRSDVRGKNRCVLVAKQAKTTKESRMNETRPKNSNSIINSYKFKNKDNSQNVLESKKKKEATQVSDIVQTPRGVFSDDDNFDLHNVVTIKDGKFVLVKLEGKDKTAYLKLLPKKNISINELKFILNDVETFSESLKEINRGFTLIEKEIVAMKTKKYEAEEVEEKEEIEDDEELEVEVDDEKDDEEESEESEEEKDSDDEAEESENEEIESELLEDQPDSVPFSVEINGVRYSGTLYAERDEESEDDEEIEDDEEDEQDEEDDDYADLILQSEDDVDDIDFPNGLDVDDEIIDADVELENVRYNVSFYDVKKECIKRAKLEMRKHNVIGAWNALVRGAGSIEC